MYYPTPTPDEIWLCVYAAALPFLSGFILGFFGQFNESQGKGAPIFWWWAPTMTLSLIWMKYLAGQLGTWPQIILIVIVYSIPFFVGIFIGCFVMRTIMTRPR